MGRISFKINGEKYSVGSEVDSDVSLNDYLRNELDLRGTKYMCKEGGCGACVVCVTAPDPRTGHPRTFSVNSCLVSITSCQDWEITTVEGIGGRHKGYHPVQKTLAAYNGTQCGYCSPGFVMSMYSLLESKNFDLTRREIENSFGSNACRCTGIRPILDAFKSFASDIPKTDITDIEDLNICRGKAECAPKTKCDHADWCMISAKDAEPKVVKLNLKDGRVWYRVHEVVDVFDIIEKEGNDYMLINGNTGRGAVPIFSFPRTLIDISPILDLKMHILDQNLVVGAGTTLTDLMSLFLAMAERTEFKYLLKLHEHLDLVAHIPVRNIGTLAGNLMLKHRLPTFPSDIFLLLETVGSVLTIVDKNNTILSTPEQFLTIDMIGKMIVNVMLPPLSEHYSFVSFKIMPRSQNAHASVNAAFLYHFDRNKETVLSARLVFGGLSGKFVHARETEEYLVGKNIFSETVMQAAVKLLDSELLVEEIPGEFKPEYRKKCALGLFYKGLLNIIPKDRLKPRYLTGVLDLRKTRPLSKGSEVYDTNPSIWPITEPMPKVEALAQCSGETSYVNDLPSMAREVFCAFVTADICTGEIEHVDPSPALKLPGVLSFISAKDIPGNNSFLSQKVPSFFTPEEIFSSGRIKYYDQPIGVIVAETEKLANRAALLVKVQYKKDQKTPSLTIKHVREREPDRVSLFFAVPARGRGTDVQRVFKGGNKMSWQYHYTMETQQCVTMPSDDGLDVYISTQWPDACHVSISEALKLDQNRINLTIPRCGGAYGSKISRSNWVACVSSLVTYLTGRPCRFAMSIQANMRVIGKRAPAETEFEVGVNNSGAIQYLEYHFYEDNGFVFSDQVIALVLSALKNCYDNARWQYKLFNVTTDTASNTWMRSPGSMEGITMTEYIMERISYELQRDPLQVRLANLNPMYPEVAEIADTLTRDSEYNKRKEEIRVFNQQSRWKKRGLGVALMSWPVVLIADYQVVMTVYHGDGTINIKHGGVEIGQGVNTKVIQIAAYTLNLPMEKIKVKPLDVFSIPNNLTTGGSRTTEAVLVGVVKCCQIILDRLSVVRETLNNPTWEVLVEAAFNRGINLQASYRVNSNDQAVYRVGGGAVTEVEVDVLTGEHDITRVDILEDVGTSVNPELDIGQTEEYLVGKNIFSETVMQAAVKLLDSELLVEEIPGEFKPEYRKKCALGLFYKGLLNIIPKDRLKPRYLTGVLDLRKTRPLSKGSEVYDTNPSIWPITEPMPKVEALAQCSGETSYVNDLPSMAREVFCAFVTADICTGEIEHVDPSPALKLPGVLSFISAKDIPGNNSFLSQKVPSFFTPEEIFSSGRIKYYDQPIGVIVAETEKLANRAALLVKVQYKKDQKTPSLTIKHVREREPDRVSLFFAVPARGRGTDVQRVFKGGNKMSWQYHYTMETQQCVTMPSDDGLDVYISTQWPDACHVSISEALKLDQNRINLTIPRCGGAYGSKISRSNWVACVSSLVTYLTGRPCRFAMSIQANMRVIGKRAPAETEFEVGVNNSGAIQYLEYHFYEDNGFVFSDQVIALVLSALKNCYDNARWQYKLFNVTTDTASNTWMRSPGSMEGITMTEYIMERISYELQRDPLQVRLANLNPMYPEVAEIADTLTRDSEYNKRKEEIRVFNQQSRWKKRGLGVALMSWPVVLIADYQVVMTVYHGDGTINIKHGGVEIGQGVNTKVIQIAAYTLNLPMEKIKVKPLDVFSIPNNLTTGGSRTTEAVLVGVVKCCQIILDRLSVVRETLNNPTWEVLVEAAFNRGINLQASYRVNSNDQAVYRVGGGAVTEVEVDVLTGEHDITRVDILEDVGTSVNPELDIGQVEGSFVMGAGLWTCEHQIYDESTGELLTDRTWYYHVPLAKDIPIDFRIKFRRNSFNPVGTMGARATGEPAACLAVSVAFAIRDAIAASREDSGIPRTVWFDVDGPFTLEANVLSANVRLDEFRYE